MILRRGWARFARRCEGFQILETQILETQILETQILETQILETGKDAQRRHGAKGPGLRWGFRIPETGSPGSLRRSPGFQILKTRHRA